MIKTHKELIYYMKADLMMNRGCFSLSLGKRLKNFFVPDLIMSYLTNLRKYEYYGNTKNVMKYWYKYQVHCLGIKLGFSISPNVFGFGLVIPHYGTIVVGNSGNKVGNYCVLHTSTCITSGKKIIGDGFYLSTGAKVVHDIQLFDNISVGANSIVNKSIDGDGYLIAGAPAKKIKHSDPWYIRDGAEFTRRHSECERLRESYLL